ncbi:MAG: ATP-dependent sacrificial sulfur transferase LarE [Candidatus Omnitrophica bacterium]|nr:ATP-dependent sacrificial sulfur transferase LarE [Candidatus Omnitrophota bacterium]
MNPTLKKKLNQVKEIISGLGSVVVAFSGGTDSGLLLKISREVLGKRVLAVIIVTDFIKSDELSAAQRLAGIIGVPCRKIKKNLLTDNRIRHNPRQRCYFCKKKLMRTLLALSRKRGFFAVIEGSNSDDAKQFRPGKKALEELGIRSPLAEAGLTKPEIRALARYYRLPNWQLPSSSCLATRFPYGTALTREKLHRVAAAEKLLHEDGFRQVRVRVQDNLARIEVEKADLPRLLKTATSVFVSKIKKLGFSFVCVDLEGFRSGSLDQ